MKTRTAGFIEMHLEKLIAALTAAFLLTMLWVYLIHSPNKVDYGGRAIGPGQLNAAILADAEALERVVGSAPADEVVVPAYGARIARVHRDGLFAGDSGGARALPVVLRPAAPFGRPIADAEILAALEESGNIRLVTPLPPPPPVAQTGRSKLVLEPASDWSPGNTRLAIAASEQTVQSVPRSWITLMTQFDREAQEDAMNVAGYAPFRAKAYIVGLDVQRQEQLANDAWSAWEDVTAEQAAVADVPVPVFADTTGTLLNRSELVDALAEIKRTQPARLQPPFYPVLVGDQWEPPNEQTYSDDGTLPLWFHDLSGVPGRKYRYRVRVRLWNRYVGQAAVLRDPAEARSAVLSGQWSRPSEPITCAPQIQFFLIGGRPDERTASIEVWKWRAGAWLRRLFTPALGDVIGDVCEVPVGGHDEDGKPLRADVDFTTGAVVLDLSFGDTADYSSPGATASGSARWAPKPVFMRALNPASGRVEERWAATDRYKPARAELRARLRAQRDTPEPPDDLRPAPIGLDEPGVRP